MTGRIADFFRFLGGLLYWNARKSLFRARGARGRHPCQTPSDSGRAYETHCEACVHWAAPARFASVCPLLASTPDGPRCSADAADVRPFWGRAAAVYGGTFATLYLVGVLGVFVFLRSIGYPVSVLHVGWPGLWYRVPQVRGWYFADRATKAFDSGRVTEGLLYLQNAYEFDPTFYAAGLTLAKSLQAGQPATSDRIFQKLLADHPARRADTAQEWLRALLPRGDFASVASLARAALVYDAAHAAPWLRALFFASRQTGDVTVLENLLASPLPGLVPWRPVVAVELHLRAGRTAAARSALAADWRALPPWAVVYQCTELTRLGDIFAALDALAHASPKIDNEAGVTLRLEAFATGGMHRQLRSEIDRLLSQGLSLPIIKILCAHLVRHPDDETLDRLFRSFVAARLPFNDASAGLWFSLYCAAGVAGDQAKLAALSGRIKQSVGSSFFLLDRMGAFLRGRLPDTRITNLLPVLPLPMELLYVLLERYPARASGIAPELLLHGKR